MTGLELNILPYLDLNGLYNSNLDHSWWSKMEITWYWNDFTLAFIKQTRHLTYLETNETVAKYMYIWTGYRCKFSFVMYQGMIGISQTWEHCASLSSVNTYSSDFAEMIVSFVNHSWHPQNLNMINASRLQQNIYFFSFQIHKEKFHMWEAVYSSDAYLIISGVRLWNRKELPDEEFFQTQLTVWLLWILHPQVMNNFKDKESNNFSKCDSIVRYRNRDSTKDPHICIINFIACT